MKIIVCIGAVLSIISVCVICLLIKFNNNTSDNDKSEENGRLSDMKLSFEDGCAFLHTDYRLDNPNYVPPEDKSRRKDEVQLVRFQKKNHIRSFTLIIDWISQEKAKE